jgi:hypothetical protein
MLLVGFLPGLLVGLAGLLLGLGHALVVAHVVVVASLGRSGRHGNGGAGEDHGRGRG